MLDTYHVVHQPQGNIREGDPHVFDTDVVALIASSPTEDCAFRNDDDMESGDVGMGIEYEAANLFARKIIDRLVYLGRVSPLRVVGEDHVQSGQVEATHLYRASVHFGGNTYFYEDPRGKCRIEHSDPDAEKDTSEYVSNGVAILENAFRHEGTSRGYSVCADGLDVVVSKVRSAANV